MTKLTLPYLQQVSSSSSSNLAVVVFIEIHRRLHRDPSSSSSRSSPSPLRSTFVSVEIRRRLRRYPSSLSLTQPATRDYENHSVLRIFTLSSRRSRWFGLQI
ncbi:hypothetical protein F2Q68_00010061 [Brassica cretica]|uniref:Uncharacterized protein n=1 Tax=Brassica cretica TaxID=69181 RepID=A0A8S9L3F7_BRACR|nr:hypothetical protein F2Q68_00010061 [Brassica cretica]